MKFARFFILLILTLLQIRINHACKNVDNFSSKEIIDLNTNLELSTKNNFDIQPNEEKTDDTGKKISDNRDLKTNEKKFFHHTNKTKSEKEIAHSELEKAINQIENLEITAKHDNISLENNDDKRVDKNLDNAANQISEEKVEVKNPKCTDLKPNFSEIEENTIKLYFPSTDSCLKYNFKSHEIRDVSNKLKSSWTPLPKSITFNFTSGLSSTLKISDLTPRKFNFGKEVEFDATLVRSQKIIVSCVGFYFIDKEKSMEHYYILIRTRDDDGIFFKTEPQTPFQVGKPVWTLKPIIWSQNGDGHGTSLENWNTVFTEENYLYFKSLDVTFFS